MPNIPGANTTVGQGAPGLPGANAIPGQITLPSGALPGHLVSTDAPVLPTYSLTPTRPVPQTPLPAPKAHDLASAMAVLDQVHAGALTWEQARGTLSQGFSGLEREALKAAAAKAYGPQAIDPLRALGEDNPDAILHPHHSFFSNLSSDISSTVQGALPGIGLAATYFGKDLYNSLTLGDPKNSGEFFNKILKPTAQGISNEVSPLLHGEWGKAYAQFHAHPLAPILDALAIASAGVGTVGRVGAATRAIRAGEVTTAGELPKGATAVVGQRAGINLSIHPLSNGLYQIRDRGRIVASRFPDEATAIAHAQSLATGGVAPAALKQAFSEAPREVVGHQPVPLTITPASHLAIEKLYDVVAAPSGGAAMDHFEDFMNRLAEHAGNDDLLYGNARAHTVKDPEAFIRQLGGMIDYGKQFAETPAELDAIEAAANEIYKSFKTKVPEATLRNLSGPASSLTSDFGEMLQNELPGQITMGDKTNRLGEEAMGVKAEYPTEPVLDATPRSGFKPATPTSPAGLAIRGATRGGTQGSLIDAYERARNITHDTELTQIMNEVADVLDNPNLRMKRRTRSEVIQDVLADLRATRAAGAARPVQLASDSPGFISPTSTGRVLSATGTTLREASDIVRAGAIYLRGGYLPNNWAGNEFMNVVQGGVFAPVNLAKSFAMDKHIGTRYTRAIDQSLGQNAAEVVLGADKLGAEGMADQAIAQGERTPGTPRGYVASLTQPIAHVMGAIADQPFRRASWLHEARRQGFRNLSQIQKLLDDASTYTTSERGAAALRQVADIGRRAQEEIVKFQHMNDIERSVLRNLVFVYSWMRGATRYGMRFPFQHPIQAATYSALSQPGNEWLKKNMGGVPNFLLGAIPVGHDSKGNPIIINPFSLNPLGTALQVLQAAQGTATVLHDPKQFNKFAQTDILGLAPPLVQSYLNAREGGRPVDQASENSIAAVRLYQGLAHPGSGSLYPTSRSEAIGHFLGGSLYPREADQQAITRSLERQNRSDPNALIPTQVTQFKKATGTAMPKEMIDAYKADLLAIAKQKDFQNTYASSHGASGFRSMPPANRATAALEYLSQYHLISPSDVSTYQNLLQTLTTDAQLNDFANTLWSSTGAGSIKRQWDTLLRDAKGSTTLTRKRQ